MAKGYALIKIQICVWIFVNHYDVKFISANHGRDPLNMNPYLESEPIQCYACNTEKDGNKCADPVFQTTLTVRTCPTTCVKWVRRDKRDGNVTSIIRACKEDLNIHVHAVAGSCLAESRSGYGELCFCRPRFLEQPCNHSACHTCNQIILLLMMTFAIKITNILFNY